MALRILPLTVYCLLFSVFCGCASFHGHEKILAVVDGDPVTEDDLKYSLTISHRKEDLSNAGALNLSKYVLKLVDDRLIIHEARTAGMDQYPEVKKALEAYILRESVIRLHEEEIVRKISVSEKEIEDYYSKNIGQKLTDSRGTTENELNALKGRIERVIRKQKEKERGDEYLKSLREKAAIKIDKTVLPEIKPDRSKEEIERLSYDKRTLAEVDGSVLTVGDFILLINPNTRRTSEDVINSWIERKLVDHEALNRHYENRSDLKKMITRYENQLLRSTFLKKVIIPQVVIDDETMKNYYASHRKDFLKPVRFKIYQITVKTADEAAEISDSLKNGADFSWLAKKRSIDQAASKGGDAGWVAKADLPIHAREIIDAMKAGDVSPVIGTDGASYTIVKLQERSIEEPEEFDKVKEAVYKACIDELINTLLEKYFDQLKKEAEIKIFDHEIRMLEAGL